MRRDALSALFIFGDEVSQQNEMPSNNGEYISLKAAAIFCGLSRKTLRRLIACGRLRGYQPGGTVRAKIMLSRRDLIAFIEASRVERPYGIRPFLSGTAKILHPTASVTEP